MNLADWGFVVGIAGLFVSFAGWGTAIWQIGRVKRASKAVTDALDVERRRAAVAWLYAASSDLKASESTLYLAISRYDRDETKDAVRSLRDVAVRVQRLLAASGLSGRDDLVQTLAELLGVVDVCLGDLMDSDVEIQAACAALVQRLSRAVALGVEMETGIITAGSEETK